MRFRDLGVRGLGFRDLGFGDLGLRAYVGFRGLGLGLGLKLNMEVWNGTENGKCSVILRSGLEPYSLSPQPYTLGSNRGNHLGGPPPRNSDCKR